MGIMSDLGSRGDPVGAFMKGFLKKRLSQIEGKEEEEAKIREEKRLAEAAREKFLFEEGYKQDIWEEQVDYSDAKNRDLIWRYGITLEEYKKYPQECNICGSKEEGRGFNMNVDHDHKTGKVRGLLCNSCNRGLGLLGEDNLEKAILYLNQSKVR